MIYNKRKFKNNLGFEKFDEKGYFMGVDHMNMFYYTPND